MKPRNSSNGRPVDRAGEHLKKRWILPHSAYLVASVHLVVFVVSYLLAYWIRFDFAIPADAWVLFWVTLPWIVALKLHIYYLAGHCSGWSYLTFSDLMVLLRAATISTVVIAAINHFLVGTAYSIPRSVILIDASTSILLLGGVRCLSRLSRWQYRKNV